VCEKALLCVLEGPVNATKSIDSVVASVRGDLILVWVTDGAALWSLGIGVGNLSGRPGLDEPVFALSGTFYFMGAIKVWGKDDDV